jgi:CubicO group peptidase (beta-lactamase class C family)/pimeloyl-ACP methyl ester carboxylesterase
MVWTGFALAQTENLPPGMSLVIRDLDRTATEAVKNPNDIGYTLAVVTREGLAWTKSYGRATSESAYRIGSGAFTAVMLLQLTRAGTVHLSDRVEKYVPELKSARNAYPDAAPVSLLQLAVHTSGLTLDVRDGDAYTKGPIADWEKTLVAALRHTSYEFEPGTHAAASNIDESILALALSRAAQQRYDEYVKQRILLPLGMTHTDFPSEAGDGGLGHRPVLYATIGDLARFASFMMLGGPDGVLSRRDLEENYRRLWITNSVAVPNPNEGFGIGFDGETWTSNHYYFILPVTYGGSGYEAALWFEPRRHAGVILLHQGSGGAALSQMIHTYVYTLNAQKNDAGRQEPARPFPYTEEEITFDNRTAGIQLAATLTVPQGNGPYPAVVLIPKSGPLDRDERLLNHRPFFVLADYLSRAGIAVLRADVRGAGKSGGKYGAAPMDDSASDVEAAIAYLRTRPEVDPHKIGLVSHGEGGLVTPLVAARTGDVAFVVMMGAPAVPTAENAVEATRLTAVGNGELYRKAEEQAAETRRIFSLLSDEKDTATLERSLREVLAGKVQEAQIAAQIRQWTSPAFRRTLTYDPSAALKKLSCPVLAVYAEKDLSVPLELNLPAMRAALASSGNRSFQVEALPDLNLLFQTADVGIGREANWVEETMSPVAMKRVAEWILQRGQ